MEYFDDDITELKNIIENKNIILKFYADWCKNCKIINEVVDNYCKLYNFKCISINIDNNPSIMEYYNVEKLPTIIMNDTEKIVGSSKIIEKLETIEIFDISEDF